MTIYKVLNDIHKDIVKIGISKDQRNLKQNYAYRGIDQLYNTISSILANHGLLVMPRCKSLDQETRVSKNGAPAYFSKVCVDFDLVASDGSSHTITSFGEAMDYADKSVNKAITAAYKYALFLLFCIPTEAQDADKDHIETEGGWFDNCNTVEEIGAKLKGLVHGQEGTPFYEKVREAATKRKNEL